jgi:hypothetical protein
MFTKRAGKWRWSFNRGRNLSLEGGWAVFGEIKGLIAIREANRWRVGQTRLHLARDASLIRQHHSNWRVEALKSLDRGQGAQNQNELHYSAVVSLSNEDALRLNELWVKTLEQFAREIAPSKDETVRALVIDFFSIGDTD